MYFSWSVLYDLSLCFLVYGNHQVQRIIVAIPKGGSDKYGVSNPQGAKGKINILLSLCATDMTLHAPNVCFQLETRNKTVLWV